MPHNVYVPKTDLITVVIVAECYIFSQLHVENIACQDRPPTKIWSFLFMNLNVGFCFFPMWCSLEGSRTDWRYALWACHIAYVSIHILQLFFFFRHGWTKQMSSHAPLNSFNLVIETFLATLQIKWPTETP